MRSTTLLLAAILIAAIFAMPAAAPNDALQPQCLGYCTLTDGTAVLGVPCWMCLGPAATYIGGASWVSYPCDLCPCPCDPYKKWESCPQCCDGIDNDGDGQIDCDHGPAGEPRDADCLCCLDRTEHYEEDEKCGTHGAVDCVPEAATIALVGVGILGIIGIGLRRRE